LLTKLVDEILPASLQRIGSTQHQIRETTVRLHHGTPHSYC
jgi:hypothetical protein